MSGATDFRFERASACRHARKSLSLLRDGSIRFSIPAARDEGKHAEIGTTEHHFHRRR
jgi:hypothetical protein